MADRAATKEKHSEKRKLILQGNKHLYEELAIKDFSDLDKAFKDRVIQGLREVKLMLNNDKKGLNISQIRLKSEYEKQRREMLNFFMQEDAELKSDFSV